MNIRQIPYHLRNTVEFLDCPIYVGLEEDRCRPPANLALGDTLMVLGLIRNQGRPVRLFLDPGPARELVEGHPLVRELVLRPEEGGAPGIQALPVARFGRAVTWVSAASLRLPVGVRPVDQVRANPILAHSRHYGLDNIDDRPSVFVDPNHPARLAGLLARQRPSLVVYPLHAGRADSLWQDREWWVALLRRLRPGFHLVAVGAPDYGELATEVDVCLPSDHPDSTLLDLAWLLGRAAGFVGREGGLAHLATAMNPRRVIIWDSMASYRFWAGSGGHHLLFCNPYTFRYPQTCRLDRGQLQAMLARMTAQVEDDPALAQASWEERAQVLAGGEEQLTRMVLIWREMEEERLAMAAWRDDPAQLGRITSQSLDFAQRAVLGRLTAGENWVAPVFP